MLKKIISIALLLTIAPALFFCQSQQEDLSGHELLQAVLWMQHAAEYKALSLQAYNIALLRLEEALQDKQWTAALEQTGNYQHLPPAVILDADETVLDNSPYEAELILTGTTYNEQSWTRWCEEARATALPGAVEFCQQAHARGVTIFYVTNRRDPLREVTRANLQALGFPLEKDLETVLTRSDAADKGARRSQIAQTHRIVLQIGDNNGDFASAFTRGSQSLRDSLVFRYKDFWGTKWIVLPNPVYGDWEGALINYQYALPETEKLRLKYRLLRR